MFSSMVQSFVEFECVVFLARRNDEESGEEIGEKKEEI